MIKFFQMGGNRGAFRDQLIDYGGGFSSLPQFLIQFGLSFGLIALFWLVYCVIFNKLDKWRTILLAIGAFGPFFASLRFASRAFFIFYLFFIIVCIGLLYNFIPLAKIKKMKKYFLVTACICLIPFMAISVARFKSNICYSFGSYFAIGPYSFNANYAARSEGGIPPLNGYLTIGWHHFLIDKFMGTNYYNNAKMYYDNYYYAGDSKRGTSPEVDCVYRNISGAYSSEFSTAIGCFIMDYPFIVVFIIVLLFSIFFSRYFYSSKKNVAQIFFSVLFFYFLLLSPMFYQFKIKNGSFQVFLFVAFIIFLHLIQNKRSDNAKKISDKTIET